MFPSVPLPLLSTSSPPSTKLIVDGPSVDMVTLLELRAVEDNQHRWYR